MKHTRPSVKNVDSPDTVNINQIHSPPGSVFFLTVCQRCLYSRVPTGNFCWFTCKSKRWNDFKQNVFFIQID